MEGLRAIRYVRQRFRLSQAADCQSMLNTLPVCRLEGSWRAKREQADKIIALFPRPGFDDMGP
jgi:hypothetical protein